MFDIHTLSFALLLGFYAGVGPAVVGITPYVGLNFAIYETLKKFVESLDSKPSSSQQSSTTSKILNLLRTGAIGGIAGGCSKFIVYPLVSAVVFVKLGLF